MARMKIDNFAYAEAPRLGIRGWLRWMWRQVTSMRGLDYQGAAACHKHTSAGP